ncbi:MAG: TonB-dependent receptor [Cytophagales bacterium]
MLSRFLIFIISFNILNAANLNGIIKDSHSQETLISAVVSIKELNITTETDLEGNYSFKNIKTGTYTLIVIYDGYKNQDVNLEIICDSCNYEKNIFLTLENTSELEAVQITTTLDNESEVNSLHKERNSNTINNIVSSRAMQLSPDVTVANVVQRISGVSIERNNNGDGQHAILRGMDKRYNYTTINGVKIPSPDNKYRFLPLDLFPTDLLDRLEVSKSLTPNQEGDAIGGAINMVMKDAPDNLYVNANLATGFSELFLQNKFKSFDFKSIKELSPYELNGKTYNAKLSDFSQKTISYSERNLPLNTIASLAIGNRLFKKRLGIMLASSYQNTYRGNNSIFFGSDNVDTIKYVTLTSQNLRFYSEQQKRFGIHLKTDFKINSRHKLQLYAVKLGLDNIQVREVKTIDFSSGYNPETGSAKLNYSIRSRFTQQRIYNTTLQGEHKILGKLINQWSLVYSKATNYIPDNTTINLRGERTNNTDQMTTVDNSTRRWEHNSDEDYSAYLNLIYSTKLLNKNIELATGGLLRKKIRENFYNNYIFQIDPNAVNKTFGKDFKDYTDIPWQLQNPRGSVATSLNYNATENINSGYFQFKLNTDKIQCIGGIRAEYTNQGYELRFPANETLPNGFQKYTDWLPSLNIKYIVSKKHVLRISYYKAVNRPGFFEIVPYSVTIDDYQERGNPALKRAIANNYDIRYEYLPKSNEQYYVGIFYKQIKNPIEYTLQADAKRGQDIYYSPGNFGNAINYGLELDLLKYYKKMGFKANYTYTHSTIETDKSLRIRDNNGSLKLINVSQSRPLYGQSAHVANISLLYKNTKKGWDAQLAASYTGKRINTVSQFLDNDIWQKGFIQMDASLEKIFKKKLTVFIKANNLLNTPTILFINGHNDQNNGLPEQNNSKETLIKKDYYNRSYMLGIKFKL